MGGGGEEDQCEVRLLDQCHEQSELGPLGDFKVGLILLEHSYTQAKLPSPLVFENTPQS